MQRRKIKLPKVQIKSNSSKDLNYFETSVKLELQEKNDKLLSDSINEFIAKNPLGDVTISPSITLEYNEPGLGAWYIFKCVFEIKGKTKIRSAKDYLISYIDAMIKDIAKKF